MFVRRVVYVHVTVKSCKNITCLAPGVIKRCQQRVSDLYDTNEHIENCKILVRVSAFGQVQESISLPCKDKLHHIDLCNETFNFEMMLADNEPDEKKLKRELTKPS
jgi:hypothetical protein